jgi:nucleoid DNA-binding protein
MNKQKEILKKIAATHGIKISQAEEIWNLLGSKISEVISSDHKTEGLFDENKFPIIHIDNFGKFVPNKRKINHANYCIKKKQNESNT